MPDSFCFAYFPELGYGALFEVKVVPASDEFEVRDALSCKHVLRDFENVSEVCMHFADSKVDETVSLLAHASIVTESSSIRGGEVMLNKIMSRLPKRFIISRVDEETFFDQCLDVVSAVIKNGRHESNTGRLGLRSIHHFSLCGGLPWPPQSKW